MNKTKIYDLFSESKDKVLKVMKEEYENMKTIDDYGPGVMKVAVELRNIAEEIERFAMGYTVEPTKSEIVLIKKKCSTCADSNYGFCTILRSNKITDKVNKCLRMNK